MFSLFKNLPRCQVDWLSKTTVCSISLWLQKTPNFDLSGDGDEMCSFFSNFSKQFCFKARTSRCRWWRSIKVPTQCPAARYSCHQERHFAVSATTPNTTRMPGEENNKNKKWKPNNNLTCRRILILLLFSTKSLKVPQKSAFDTHPTWNLWWKTSLEDLECGENHHKCYKYKENHGRGLLITGCKKHSSVIANIKYLLISLHQQINHLINCLQHLNKRWFDLNKSTTNHPSTPPPTKKEPLKKHWLPLSPPIFHSSLQSPFTSDGILKGGFAFA